MFENAVANNSMFNVQAKCLGIFPANMKRRSNVGLLLAQPGRPALCRSLMFPGMWILIQRPTFCNTSCQFSSADHEGTQEESRSKII